MSVSVARHIYLAGFMGTGKSAAGQIVAQRLTLPFIDLDEVIERETGRTISSIFTEEGEPAFRQYETDTLMSIVISPRSVIALGGGAPTVPEIRTMVKETGIAFLLTADWPTIWNRIRGDSSRPLLAGALDGTAGDPFERFVATATPILESRIVDYDAIADYTIDTSALSPDDVAERILAIVRDIFAQPGD